MQSIMYYHPFPRKSFVIQMGEWFCKHLVVCWKERGLKRLVT